MNSSYPNNLIYQLAPNVQLEMVYIKGGKFLMGSNNGDDNQKPQHEVTVSEFALGKYPVTQAQYKAIMGDNPSHFKEDNLPVESVTWDNAVAFCKKLSQKTGKEFRLPSEAEWEYTCRAGSEKSYCFGDDQSKLKDYAWYSDNSNNQTHPVGQKKPNDWKLYDMHGNVWEWCADDCHDNYNGAPNDGSIWLNKHGTKMLRGGSWGINANLCRCAYRNRDARVPRNNLSGFRVALGIPRTT